MYAILDIETTGGKFNEEGITEIAIHKFDGQQITDSFISLVNPEREIQEYVTKLTGINTKMLVKAPKFFEIAKQIVEITQNCILVAHNSQFDYRILRTEFRRLGFDFERNTICTVELSKKLILNQPSYSLGKLCRGLGIPITDRHRANGDALATVKLFKLLLTKDNEKNILEKTIKYSDNRNQKRKIIDILDSLPESEGIFYIHNSEGNIIYIGRGKNIKLAVNKLFLKQSNRAKKILKRVQTVSFEKTGNQLFTRLKYYLELDAIKPSLNIVRKRKASLKNFQTEDMIIVDSGREPEENAIILIQKNELFGYGYTNLSFQEHQIDILKSVLTPITNKTLAKTIVKNYIDKHKVKKIIRLTDID